MRIEYDYGKLDFNKPITAKDIDWEVYNNKFRFVDLYIQSETPNPMDFVKIWEDKTMFSYQFLQLDTKPLRLFPYQDIILGDNHRFMYIRTGRQMGKSILLDVDATKNLVEDHGYSFNECIISANLSQAGFQMRRIKDMLSHANFDIRQSKGNTDNTTILTLDIKDKDGKTKYSNMLVVVPCSEAARGYNFHCVYLDEFEYWDVDVNYMYNSVIEPTTFATNGKIKICSTPNGSESFGAELERIMLPNKNKKFHTYVFNFYDKVGVTDEDIEFAKAGKTRQQIESEILAIRSISSKNYFTPQEIDKSRDETLTELDMVSKQPIFFLDVGSKHDQSVLVGGFVEYDGMQKDVHGNPIVHFYIPIIHAYPVGYPLARVVGSNVDVSDGWHYEKSVREYLDEWSVDGIKPTFGVDVTGNSGISPLFNTAGIYPQDIVFSGPKKSGMYQRFKYIMEKGLLHRIPSQAFDYQASHLEMQKTARGYLAIHHASEDDLDDVCDAVAGFIHLADNPDFVETSLELF